MRPFPNSILFIGSYFKLLDLWTYETNDSESVQKIFDWTKRYCKNCTATSPEIYKPALDLFLKLTGRVKTDVTIVKDLAIKIRSGVGLLNQSIEVSSVHNTET